MQHNGTGAGPPALPHNTRQHGQGSCQLQRTATAREVPQLSVFNFISGGPHHKPSPSLGNPLRTGLSPSSLKPGCDLGGCGTARMQRMVFSTAWKAHKHFVLSRIQNEESIECPNCVVLKLTYNEISGHWDLNASDAVGCALDSQQEDEPASAAASSDKRTESADATGNIQQQQQQQQSRYVLQGCDHCSCFGQEGGAAPAAVDCIVTSFRQVYISTWAAACFGAMAIIALIFITQTVTNNVWLDDGGSGPHAMPVDASSRENPLPCGSVDDGAWLGHAGLDTASGGRVVGKNTAMLMVFLYAGLGWMMSNGLVLSPRRVHLCCSCVGKDAH